MPGLEPRSTTRSSPSVSISPVPSHDIFIVLLMPVPFLLLNLNFLFRVEAWGNQTWRCSRAVPGSVLRTGLERFSEHSSHWGLALKVTTCQAMLFPLCSLSNANSIRIGTVAYPKYLFILPCGSSVKKRLLPLPRSVSYVGSPPGACRC